MDEVTIAAISTLIIAPILAYLKGRQELIASKQAMDEARKETAHRRDLDTALLKAELEALKAKVNSHDSMQDTIIRINLTLQEIVTTMDFVKSFMARHKHESL